MTSINSTTQTSTINKKVVFSVLVFILVVIAGLMYVKWWPYYHKAMDAAANHSIGSSIVSGKTNAAPTPSWNAAWDYAMAYYKSVWKAAVLGILLGSLLQVLLPSAWLLKVLGRSSFKNTMIGGVSSLPGMMCTCCAAPIAVGLRKKNVSVSTVLAFWLGNPTLNPATLVFMTFVLSWKFTLLRLVFGLVLTFGVSYYARLFAGKMTATEEMITKTEEVTKEQTGSFLVRWPRSLGSMLLYVVPAYIITVLILGASRAWLFPVVGEAAGNSILLIIGFAIAGLLFVIPTAAEIPIIQTMMSFGLGVGPAAALLITLPSVSLPSLLMVSRSFPRKVLVFVALSILVLGVLSGVVGSIVL